MGIVPETKGLDRTTSAKFGAASFTVLVGLGYTVYTLWRS